MLLLRMSIFACVCNSLKASFHYGLCLPEILFHLALCVYLAAAKCSDNVLLNLEREKGAAAWLGI